ncbi:hypothetical protein SMC26_32915 [Actinomadura fulvescens]|uniref:Integrase n=1 Tax=Actinomadura fulvescens TaxID=46160 RepID=A0ABP6CN42_9ACTN
MTRRVAPLSKLHIPAILTTACRAPLSKLRQTNHGSWWACYDAPQGVNGKRRQPRLGPYRTKTDAQDGLADELGKVGHAFLDFAAEERLYALFHLTAFRGPRRAEVAGPPWTDLDQSGSITVRETRPDDDDTKSEAGDRNVGLDEETVKVLRAWRTRQKEEKLKAGLEVWIDSGRVFTRPDGSALRPEWISQRFAVERYNAIRRRHYKEGWPSSRSPGAIA